MLCVNAKRAMLVLSLLDLGTGIARAASIDYFGLHFIDAQTGRGVPLVQVELTSKEMLYSDSNGYVAFNEPGLMDQPIFFGVKSYGYTAKDAGFGNPGLITRTVPGKCVDVKLERTNIAERLYRLTGEGIYRDSVLLGKTSPIAHPLINAKVTGQDTVETVVYGGKMLWCWGDTNRTDAPLGNFSTSGATSALPGQLNLEQGIDFTYFTSHDGFCRPMIQLDPPRHLPVWIDALMNVADAAGHPHLLARYVVSGSSLKIVECGLLQFDDADETFKLLKPIPLDSPTQPGGHPLRATVDGTDYFYFPVPYPTVRVRADYAHASDPSQYEGFTCLKPGAAFSKDRPDLNRDESDVLRWSWQRATQPIGPKQMSKWIAAGLLRESDSPFRMRNVETGKAITVANGSVAWDEWAGRWIMLFGQLGGTSNLGEIFIAFASTPEGPWTDAQKVATHTMKGNNNDFYNPMLHAEFMQQKGRVIFFEGTLVTTFSGNPHPTPRYDYNQILYRLDLADPRLKLPAPARGLDAAEKAVDQKNEH